MVRLAAFPVRKARSAGAGEVGGVVGKTGREFRGGGREGGRGRAESAVGAPCGSFAFLFVVGRGEAGGTGD